MTCSQCWTTAPTDAKTCPRCGAALTGAPPSFKGLFKAYPWLGVVLALSVIATLWAATRRSAPPPERIPPAVEPVVEAPALSHEAEAEPEAAPAPAPEPAAPPAAPRPVRSTEDLPPPPPPSSEAHQNPDGTWGTGAPSRGGG